MTADLAGALGDPAAARAAVPSSLDPAAQLQRLETIFRLAPVGIGIVDLDGQTIMANDTLRMMLGYTPDEFASKPWVDYTHPDDVQPNIDMHARMAAREIDHFALEKRFICKDGSVLWASLTSSMVYAADGSPDYVIGMVQDITERKRLEERLGHQAFHDSLTGLPNRRFFHDRVDQALARMRERRRGGGRALRRPGPLQDGQRQLRARVRRPGDRHGVAPDQGLHPRRRRGGPARR